MIVPTQSPQAGNFRLKRGTKSSAAASCSASELPSLSSIDGPFQLAEYLTLKVRADPHDVASLVEVPAEGRSTDRDVWIYEHLRRIPIDLTPLVSQLLTHCTKESCPEMKADQWQYLCVAHGSGVSEECCAIDYILHTLDSATGILNSTKNFPSRMSIPPGSMSHFPSLSRRLSRIFSHAYFHHREQFLLSESETSLYARFVALCEAYGLVGKDLLIIPHPGKSEETSEDEETGSEEEGGDGDDDDEREEDDRTRDKEKGGKRTLSLDRQSGVGFKVLSREKGKGKVTESEDLDNSKVEKADLGAGETLSENKATPSKGTPVSLLPKATEEKPEVEAPTSAAKTPGTFGRGTKGRGKQGRGTMLWSSDSPDVPAIPELPVLNGGHDLTRTESRETAIFIGDETSEGEAESPNPPTIDLTGQIKSEEAAELPVPKDEIELLEEAGVLKPGSTVSPIPPPVASEEQPATQTEIAPSGPDAAAKDNSIPASKSNEEVKSVDPLQPSTVSPKRQPNLSPTPKFSPTAATSPLNPPRSLSRSPEARHKALAGPAPDAASPSPSKMGKDGGKSKMAGSGLSKIEQNAEDQNKLDAEGSKAVVVPDVPERAGSPVVVKKGEGKDNSEKSS